MLNRSNFNLDRAEAAEVAQLLRGGIAFGSVVFSEKVSFEAALIRVEPGYENCLPILGGACWRDPANLPDMETMK